MISAVAGLSDRNVADFSIDAQVGDLETVVDALGLGRFPLLGLGRSNDLQRLSTSPENAVRLSEVFFGIDISGAAAYLGGCPGTRPFAK